MFTREDAGLGVLYFLCRSRGYTLDLPTLRRLSGVAYGPLSFAALEPILQSLGWQLRPFHVDLTASLERPQLPWLLETADGKPIVLSAFHNGQVTLFDPEVGEIQIRSEALYTRWLQGSDVLVQQLLPPQDNHKLGALLRAKQTDAQRAGSVRWRSYWISGLLEGLTILFFMQWIGLLFSRTLTPEWIVWPVLAVSLALAAAWYLLRWGVERSIRGLASAYLIPQEDWSFRPSLREGYRPGEPDGPALEGFMPLPVQGALWWRYTAGLLLMVLYLVYLFPPAGLVALGLTILVSRQWQGTGMRYRSDEFRRSLKADLQEKPTARLRARVAVGYHRSAAWPAAWRWGMLAVWGAFTVIAAWYQAIAPDGFLVTILAGLLWWHILGQWARAIRRKQIGGLALEQYDAPVLAVADLTGSDLIYRWDDSRKAPRDLRIPGGKTTLFYGGEELQAWPILSRLLALEADPGGSLLLSEQVVRQADRPVLWRGLRIIGPGWLEPLGYQAPVSADPDRWKAVCRVLLLDPAKVTFQEGVPILPEAPEKAALGQALMADPPLLILDRSTSMLESFEELVILENIIEYRKGRTTILVNNREELRPLVDHFWSLDDLSAGISNTFSGPQS